MKLLICTQAVDSNHPILGFFHGWLLEFSKHFEEVHVICLGKGEYALPPNVHVYSLGKEEGESKLKYLYRFYRHFGGLFFRGRIDFVFFHMGAVYNILGAPFFLLRKMFGTKFYWWKAHGHINTMGKLALLFVDRVYTSTESGFSIPTKKRRVVGQAIDTTQFIQPEPSKERSKEIIFVGRVMQVKRIEDFLYTAALLLEQDSSLSFKIIGPTSDAAYYQKLRAQMEELGIQDHVVFTGPMNQQELVEIYQNALIFLNTSKTGSMDKTVLEAALCGCVPVTGNKAFVELLTPCGLYVGDTTPQKYAEVITKVLASKSASLCTQLRKSVEEEHSLSTFSNRIFNI